MCKTQSFTCITYIGLLTCIVEVLMSQPIKFNQVVATSEFYEY